jgi:hypothetical protein
LRMDRCILVYWYYFSNKIKKIRTKSVDFLFTI